MSCGCGCGVTQHIDYTIQYNTMRQIEIKILLWCPHAMDGATASLVTIDLMEQCDESDSSYRLIVSKQRGSEK